MPDSFKKTRLITTTGATSGFVGFYTNTEQNITVGGPFIYGASGGGPQSFTMTFPANSTLRMNCTSLQPANVPILGWLA